VCSPSAKNFAGDAGGVEVTPFCAHVGFESVGHGLRSPSAVSIDCLTWMRLRPVKETEDSLSPVGGPDRSWVVELSGDRNRPSVRSPPGRSLRSRSLFISHCFNTSAHSSHPFCLASISGVTPCLSARLGWAPRRRRRVTASVFPFAAAKWRGVDPEVPTIGTDESRFLSFEKRRGSLDDIGKAEMTLSRQSDRLMDLPRCVNIGSVVYKQLDKVDVPSSAGSMERQNTIKNGVDRLAVI